MIKKNLRKILRAFGLSNAKEEQFAELVQSLVSAIVIVVTFQTVAYQNFHIPSGSMKPSLLIGDFLFVSKFAYGYSKFSIPFHPPLFEGRIFEKEPKMGDVTVFRPHFNIAGPDFVKRMVAGPGHSVQMKEGILFIDDAPCPLEKVSEDFIDHLELQYSRTGEERVWDEKGRRIPQYIQTLPNGVKHLIAKEKPFGLGPLDDTERFVVPEGHFFMMGDNRDGSDDSRDMGKLGFVPSEYLVGRAELLYFSTSARWWEVWKWLTRLRYNRLFHRVD